MADYDCDMCGDWKEIAKDLYNGVKHRSFCIYGREKAKDSGCKGCADSEEAMKKAKEAGL